MLVRTSQGVACSPLVPNVVGDTWHMAKYNISSPPQREIEKESERDTV